MIGSRVKTALAVADPGFPRLGGGTNSKGWEPTYNLGNFTRKLYKNEKIELVGVGQRHASLRPSISANDSVSVETYFISQKDVDYTIIIN